MKTAIQEWIEWLKAYEYELPLELQIKAKELLEKEKEQIIETYKDCQDNVLRMIMEKTKFPQAEEYYNQTYNTKQHIIDIMKADEEDGLYNENK